MKKSNNAYTVKFLLDGWYHDEGTLCVLAHSKEDAYNKAIKVIFNTFGKEPFGAYVYSVTYQNGNYRLFDNDYGNAY